MKAKKLTPLLWTENIDQTIDFYTNKLGFVCVEKNEDWQWANLCCEEVEIMIAKPNKSISYDKITFTGSFYFKIDNIEELWEKLKNETKIVYSIENFEWGMREFAINDNNGYILQFGEEITI